MSLVGIRDMSIIETPPKDRLSIQTNVVKFDQRGDRARDSQRAGARRPGVFRAQPRRVDLSIGNLLQRLVPEAQDRRRPRPDGRGSLERAMLDFIDAQVRRPAGDDDRRERARHSEREHDHHQSRRSRTACRSSISCAAAVGRSRSPGAMRIC